MQPCQWVQTFKIMTREIIESSLNEAKRTLEDFIASPDTIPVMSAMVDVLAECFNSGGKVISCGNGGSLCDATHFAEELTGRFRKNRRPLPAMAVNDPAYMTCTGNDFEFNDIFARWVEAFGKEGDVLLAISTSGNSRNIAMAAEEAHRKGMKVIGMTAEGDTLLKELADVCLCSPRTPYSDRIQEIHIKVIHIVIEALEKRII